MKKVLVTASALYDYLLLLSKGAQNDVHFHGIKPA